MKNLTLRITNRRITKLIAFVILALSIATTDAYAFTNRPSKPPVGARIDPLHSMNRDLVAWWLFNDGAGSTLTDIIGKHRGSLTNMDANAWVGSPRGGSLNFDGTNDRIPIAASSSFVFTGDFAMSAWINTLSTTERKIWGSTNEVVWTADAWHWGYLNGDFVMGVGGQANTHTYAVGTLHDGNWHQLTIVRVGTTIFVFADGSQKASFTQSGTLGNATFRTVIGALEPSGAAGAMWSGGIDDVRAYNRAPSADEVAELYRNPYVGLIKSSPVKWYGVDDPPASFTPTVTWW